MKALLCAVLALAAGVTYAASTINPADKHSYGANVGWMDWRADSVNGATVGEFVCSGFIFAANAGWINLGSGAAANGIRYQNNSSADFGVNHDGLGNLSGQAWAANLGWLTFTNRDAGGTPYDGPKVDLFTGRLSGFIWSANCGWISLSNAQAFVATDSLRIGRDTDGDGLPDDWERFHAGDLAALNDSGDHDGDGETDAQEYMADTDPMDPNSVLRITAYAFGPAGSPVDLTWNSRPTRLYRVLRRTELGEGFLWLDVGLGTFSPDSGNTTTRGFADPTSPQRFFEVEAVKPLAP